MIPRRQTRRINIGAVAIGGNAPISIQTMGNADPHDAAACLRQIDEAAELGCDIFRLAIPDTEAATTLAAITARSKLPLVADIHFDYRLALAALESGVDALRINPGNIGGEDRVKAVVEAARARRAPIRIGVNGGSLEKELRERFGGATPEALVESALRHVHLLEALDFFDIKISVKASDIPRTLAAYRLLSQRVDYPLHLGLTEAGTFLRGTVSSAIALGTLLQEGIGDTIRVSLTDTPAREVRVGLEILRACNLRAPGAWVTACPTCGRTKVDVQAAAERVTDAMEAFYRANPAAKRLHVAVMGCVVNGPGEAKDADLAIAGGNGSYALYRKGEHLRTVPEGQAIEALLALLREQALV